MSDDVRRREARLVEINTKIAGCLQWGALLTVLSEERRGVERALKAHAALPSDLTSNDVKAFFSLPDDDDTMHSRPSAR